MSELLFLPGNIPSVKNSKVMGKYPSKTVQKWLRLYGIQSYHTGKKDVKFFKTIPKQYDFEEILQPIKKLTNYPIKLGFYFIRGTKHSCDFHNMCQIVADLMVAFDIIPDDSMEYFLPFPLELNGKYFHYDKEESGLLIKILE